MQDLHLLQGLVCRFSHKIAFANSFANKLFPMPSGPEKI